MLKEQKETMLTEVKAMITVPYQQRISIKRQKIQQKV